MPKNIIYLGIISIFYSSPKISQTMFPGELTSPLGELWLNDLIHTLLLRPRLHQGKTQIFPRGLASHLHENPVFITENKYF